MSKKKLPRNRITYRIKKAFLKRSKGEKEFPETWITNDTWFGEDETILKEGERRMLYVLFESYERKNRWQRNPWRKEVAQKTYGMYLRKHETERPIVLKIEKKLL